MYYLEMMFNSLDNLVLAGVYVLLAMLTKQHRELLVYLGLGDPATRQAPQGQPPGHYPPTQATPASPIANWINLLSIAFFILAGFEVFNVITRLMGGFF